MSHNINFSIEEPNITNNTEWFQSIFKNITINNIFKNNSVSGNTDIKKKLTKWLNHRYYSNIKEKNMNINYYISEDQLFMTNGITGTLHLILSKYSESGDNIIIDNPTNYHMINIFKEYGLELKGINMEIDGVNIEELNNMIKNINSDEKNNQGVLFYYIVPTNHNPTGITINHTKRLELAKLCDKYKNLYIISDESYQFISCQKNEYIPLADYHPKIISLGSFSKILTSSLHVGWLYQNTKLNNFKLDYSFISGDSGLNKSSILESYGCINPLGFKFIEHALDNIDTIIASNMETITCNFNLMCDYLEQFNNISFIKPKGGLFIWLKLNYITNSDDFLKYCQKYNLDFITGNRCSTNSDFMNYIRLSFSYYDSTELLLGLEQLMECINNYNIINVMIVGESNINSIIKNKLLENDNFNYIDKIENLYHRNSVIIIIDYNCNDLVKELIKQKIYIPIILCGKTYDIINTYKKYAPILHINDFSYGNQIIKEITQLFNKYKWKSNESFYSFGSELINIKHTFEEDKLDYLHYIYWILTKSNGYYNMIYDSFVNMNDDNLNIIDMNKDLPFRCYKYMITKTSEQINNGEIISLIRNNSNSNYTVLLYKKQDDKIVKLNYCIDTLFSLIDNYIDNMMNGVFIINNIEYIFTIDDGINLELPQLDYCKNNTDEISDLITQMCDINLLGIGIYNNKDNYYLVLEVGNNIMNSEILETITTILNYDKIKYNIVFIKNFNDYVNMRAFDINSNEIYDDPNIYVSMIEYYMYHFHKDYKKSLTLLVKLYKKDLYLKYKDYINFICKK